MPKNYKNVTRKFTLVVYIRNMKEAGGGGGGVRHAGLMTIYATRIASEPSYLPGTKRRSAT